MPKIMLAQSRSCGSCNAERRLADIKTRICFLWPVFLKFRDVIGGVALEITVSGCTNCLSVGDDLMVRGWVG